MPSNESDFPWRTLENLGEPPGNVVLVRVDFNVPIEDGRVTDYRRIDEALPTIRWLLDEGYRPVLMSHLGRPGGTVDPDVSLKSLCDPLSERLDHPVRWADDCIGDSARSMVNALGEGEVGLLENLRFHEGEKANDASFASELASVADAYVNDAFGASHRNHASIAAVTEHLDPAVAGRLLEKEYRVLTDVRDHAESPFTVVMGGAKVSDKLPVLRRFLDLADRLLVGGAMAHTFFLAQGHDVGESLVEADWRDSAESMLNELDDYDCDFVLPEDVIVETPSGSIQNCSVDAIPSDGAAKDIGQITQSTFRDYLANSRTVFWNGPLGVFEESAFEAGTRAVIEALENHSGRVVVGGGDSGAAVREFSDTDRFDHVSTGGGAALTLMQDGDMPGYEMLDKAKTKA